MSPVIRPATTGDAEAIAALINGVIAEGRLTIFTRPFTVDAERGFIASLGPRSRLLVAETGAGIVGAQSLDRFSAWADSLDHVATMGTWLAPEARGQGIGRRLATATLDAARSLDYSKVVVTVLHDNARAIRFYRRLGFETIGLARAHARLGDDLVDELFMELLLDARRATSGSG